MSIQNRVDPVSLQRWRRQPLKGLVIAFTVATLFIRVPYYMVASIPRSLRLRPTWSFKTSVLTRLLRPLSWVATRTGSVVFETYPANYTTLATGTVAGEEIKGVWVEEVSPLIKGRLESWANAAAVSSVRLPGYWLHRPGTSIEVGTSSKPGEKVLYGLHSGGYAQMSAHPGSLSTLMLRNLLSHCNGVDRAFTLEYRLSVGPPQGRHPFPTALIDALAGYNYLVNVLGFSPSNIIIVGDSAGGNLALALIRYLVEYQMSPGVLLPSPPGFLALLSPWADIGTSHIRSGSSEYTNSATDILSNDQLDYCGFAFMGPHGIKAIDTNEYISPASLKIPHVSFVGFPRTFIVSGGAETLLDQIRTLRDRMVKDLGSAVVYYEGQDGIHNYPCFDFFEPLRSNTLGMTGKWITAP